MITFSIFQTYKYLPSLKTFSSLNREFIYISIFHKYFKSHETLIFTTYCRQHLQVLMGVSSKATDKFNMNILLLVKLGHHPLQTVSVFNTLPKANSTQIWITRYLVFKSSRCDDSNTSIAVPLSINLILIPTPVQFANERLLCRVQSKHAYVAEDIVPELCGASDVRKSLELT